VRRKAYLVIFNIYQTHSNYVNDLKALALEALADETPVMMAGLSLLYPLVMQNPHQHKDVIPKLVEILRNILNHNLSK
jgi:vesicle coat complex subunit